MPPQQYAYAPQAWPQQPMHDPDEINLLEYIYVLVKAKWWIIGATVAGLIIGYVAALIKGPTYVAEAVIAPKESQTQKTPNLSGLGMFGGIVASQFNIGGNPGLEKIDVILDSKKFHAEMAEKYRLYPFLFPKLWDPVNDKWAANVEPPKALSVGGYIKGEFLEKELDKNGTMIIKIKSADSLLSDTILSALLAYLDTYIKTTVQQEAKGNKDYLENQLISITDPLLRGKIQELIAAELEHMMVVSKEAFKVIDPELTTKNFREKKLYPTLLAFLSFFSVLLFSFFCHAFSSGNRSAENKMLLNKIRSNISIFYGANASQKNRDIKN